MHLPKEIPKWILGKTLNGSQGGSTEWYPKIFPKEIPEGTIFEENNQQHSRKKNPRGIPEEIAEKVPKENPGTISEKILEKIPKGIPGENFEGMLGKMPEQFIEGIPLLIIHDGNPEMISLGNPIRNQSEYTS